LKTWQTAAAGREANCTAPTDHQTGHAGCFRHGSATEATHASRITSDKANSSGLAVLPGIDDWQRAFARTARCPASGIARRRTSGST